MASNRDKKFMLLALMQAKKSLLAKDYPVGAVLVIDRKVIDSKRNTVNSSGTWSGHAEAQIIFENSTLIKKAKRLNSNCQIELFSTLEPCLMCLGCALMNRINRIVYSCPDPRGGASKLNKKGLSSYYKDNWPKIEKGPFIKESYKMIMEFMKNQSTPRWRKNKILFKKISPD